MRQESDTVARIAFLVLGLVGMFGLFGYMELRHEVERITSETALVTNHFTGEVRQCNTAGTGDWGCRPVEIEPRHLIFALIPFWPARDEPGEDLYVPNVPADETAFLTPQISGDMGTYTAFIIVMIGFGFILREKNWTGGTAGSGGDGGSDGGGGHGGGE